jgi:hypothetical protein
MRSLVVMFAIALVACGCSGFAGAPAPIEPWYPAANASGDPLFAVFESRLPCTGECQRLKFGLALYRDRSTQAPTTYRMARVYVAGGEEQTINEGAWSIAAGTKLDPNAVVFRLDPGAPREFSAYWAIGEDILFVLDESMGPRLGTAGYGYALNRTK